MLTKIERLQQSEYLARAPKLKRLFSHPLKYILSIGYKNFIYSFLKNGWVVSADTFYGKRIKIVLPASTDIYLTGAKSHDSEIRLAKFLIHHVKQGDTFVDVGAHFGYFTLLAAELVGNTGNVISFEASKSTFKILNYNLQSSKNITSINKAISDKNGTIDFYEFPALYSEYDTMHVEQFEKDSWFVKHKPQKISVETATLDSFFEATNNIAQIIKIDVEGAENKVISGAAAFLNTHNTIVVMEYLDASRHNANHREAKKLLEQYGYKSHIILGDGNTELVSDIESYLAKNHLESDNVVFKKQAFEYRSNLSC